MSDKKYVVSVIGLLKRNGQIANYGEEVSSDDFENFDDRVKGNYVKTKSDFNADQKDAAKDSADADQAAKDLSALRNDLLDKYVKAFKVPAPSDSSNDDIQNAIDTKSQIKAK